jgi:hypothetical protein
VAGGWWWWVVGHGQERAYYDNLSDLYSIVVTMEHLEKAYVRESIEGDEYTKACSQLLAQFKTCKEAVMTGGLVQDLTHFYREYHLETCRQAIQRLKEGVPATVCVMRLVLHLDPSLIHSFIHLIHSFNRCCMAATPAATAAAVRAVLSCTCSTPCSTSSPQWTRSSSK